MKKEKKPTSFEKPSMICGLLFGLFMFAFLFNFHIYNLIPYNFVIKDECVENPLPLKVFGMEGGKIDVDRKRGARGGRGLYGGIELRQTPAVTLHLTLYHVLYTIFINIYSGSGLYLSGHCFLFCFVF